MKKNKKIIISIISIFMLLTLVVTCSISNGQSNSNSTKNNSDDELLNNPMITGLSNTPQKEGILSQQQAAISGIKNAIKYGLIELLSNQFPYDYLNIRLADMFLVEDGVNGDYYVTIGEKSDGALAVMASIEATTGKVLETFINSNSTNIDSISSSIVSSTISLSINNSAQIKDIKKEFIRDKKSYDRLTQWKYVAELNKPITTSSGDRSILLISPIIDKRKNVKPKVSVFSTIDEEKKYRTNKAFINKNTTINYSTNNTKAKEIYNITEIN